MPVTDLIFDVLASGATLAASEAVAEFANGAGKSAFDALKNRLTAKHGAKSLPLLQEAATNPAYEAAIKSELEQLEVDSDPEIIKLLETLCEAITALPAETQARYAVNIDEIRAGGALLFEGVEGIKAKSATSATDMTFKLVNAPPGNL